MAIDTIGVVGAGQMGAGIAQVAAQSGLHVLVHDASETAIAGALAGIDDLRGADFVIEAASEAEAVKIDLFRRLNTPCRISSSPI